ncbi:MAG: hypothetical protein ACK448_00305 [Bacteroidota bacterium]|jgi:hypothetical protein
MKHLEFYVRFLLLSFFIVGWGHQDSLQAGVAWANDLDNVLLIKDIPARNNPADTARLKEVKLTNDYYRWEVTTNATLALSRFAGNTTRSLDDDPYMLMVRKFDRLYNDSGYIVGSAGDSQGVAKPLRRHNWRLGYNGYVGTSIDALTGATRETEDSRHSLVIGREWRKVLDKDFYIFGGLDVRAFYILNQSTTTSNNDLGVINTTISHRSEIGGGFDVFGGLGYRINKRLSVYTESILMFQGSRIDRYFDFNSNRTTLESTQKLGFRPMVPVSLFVSYSF